MSQADGVLGVDDADPRGRSAERSQTSAEREAWRGLDILRLEPFGALHYSRATAAFQVFTPEFTALLLEAQHRHIMEAYADDSRGIDAVDFILEVARLRDLGILDEDHRLHVRVVRPDDLPAEGLSAPMVTNIQLTRACNLHCDHCFVEVETKRHPDELSLEQFKTLFGELQLAGSPLVILAGGEPMMRPDFWEVIDAAVAADLDVALCSNATMITDDNAPRLAASGIKLFSISLDGATAEVHDRLRGHRAFERAVRGVRALVAARAPGIKLRVTVTADNADTIADFAATAAGLGVPEIVFKPFRHSTGGEALTSTQLYIKRSAYLRAVDVAMKAWPNDAPPATFDDGMPESLPAWTRVTPSFGCVGGTTHASVIFDGRVVSCDAVLTPKDWTLHERGFIESWRSSPTINSWRHLSDSGDCRSCSNFEGCGGGCRARALAAGLSMGDPDPWSYCEDTHQPGQLRILQ